MRHHSIHHRRPVPIARIRWWFIPVARAVPVLPPFGVPPIIASAILRTSRR